VFLLNSRYSQLLEFNLKIKTYYPEVTKLICRVPLIFLFFFALVYSTWILVLELVQLS